MSETANGLYKRNEFENSLNNLGIIGHAKRLWLNIFRKDPERATKGIFNKIVYELKDIIIDEEEEDETSWDYIYKKNNYLWGDSQFDWDLIQK
jgi:hypothetical protein